ncbi:MAG: 2'-5' RNA ligase family protein [Pseudomonadota bacterium]
MPFVPHTGTGKFQRYLAQNVPFSPIENLRHDLENTLDQKLSHRGEAHITVITPPEYERLSSALSIDSINLLLANRIQQQEFSIDCLGTAEKTIDGVTIATYFLVIQSPDLERIRKEIARHYRDAGGSPPAFTSYYYPHITIGFLNRDLHASDSVFKDQRHCISKVQLK